MVKLFKFVLKVEADHAFEYVVMAETLPLAFQQLRAYFANKYERDLTLNDIHNMIEVEGNVSETFC